MATAADFRRAIEVSNAYATGLEPNDLPQRALFFVAYLSGTLRAMDETGMHKLLQEMLPTNPAAAAAPAAA